MGNFFSRHPHLDSYFAELGKTVQNASVEISKSMSDKDFAALENTWKEIKGRDRDLKEVLKTHAINAFKHHDKDRNGVLNASESKVFFQDYVDCYIKHFKQNGIAQAEKCGALAAAVELGGEDRKYETNQHMVEQQMQKLSQEVGEKLEAYENNQEALNKAAFAVLDVAEDGQLQQQEVVDALTPQHPKNIAFHTALGLITELEAITQGD